MTAIQFTRLQRRQMQKLADRVDRVTQADKRFFERFPDRKHRVRLASQAEIGQFAITGGIPDLTPTPGYEHYVLVKKIAPGCRVRLPFTSGAGNDTDVSECEAAWLYNSRSTDHSRMIEAQMLQAMEARA